MSFLTQLLSPTTMRLMALTLLHFLWQGTVLAAFAYAGFSFCRSASSRYVTGLALLVAMAAVPAITFLTLHSQESVTPGIHAVTTEALPGAAAVAPAHYAAKRPSSLPTGVPNYFLWLVEMWFAGVMIFSLRSAGGVLVVEHLRRKESRQVSERVRALCSEIQRRMGLRRLVKFYECNRLHTPAVAGWLRPVVMLPVTALTGLNEAQLSSVIAHELAHIKRFDSLINLFQIAVETLLFYHPAVWWLNKRIREERENCCDDIAVEVCGNPLTYAHALARLAESPKAPRLMMAANARPLAARVARLLGVTKKEEIMRGANFSLGLVCVSISLIAGGALIGVAHTAHAQTPAPPADVPIALHADLAGNIPRIGIIVRPEVAADLAAAPNAAPSPKLAPSTGIDSQIWPSPVVMPEASPAPNTATPQSAATSGSSSYIDGLKAAGLENLTVDQIIELKIQGVTPEYVKSMHELGVKLDPDELVGMKIQGVTSEYVREMRAATGQSLDSDALVGMKIQGVTPEYVKQMHDLGLKIDADELVGMKIQGITPEYIRAMRELNLKPDADNLMAMKIQGVTPEYVKSINALGFHPDADDLIAMKVQGIDADYLNKMQAAGFKLDVEDAIAAKVMGVTPEFVEKVRSHGFKDLSMEQLMGLKQSGVLDEAKH